jgi:hypothetical protein
MLMVVVLEAPRRPVGTSAARNRPLPANLRRDQKTVAAMVRIFCHDHHGDASETSETCPACQELNLYAHARLASCPFGDRKTTCRVCPIHCYRPAERHAMTAVMRYAGPKMLLRHPWLTIRHLWLERQGPPEWPIRRSAR